MALKKTKFFEKPQLNRSESVKTELVISNHCAAQYCNRGEFITVLTIKSLIEKK